MSSLQKSSVPRASFKSSKSEPVVRIVHISDLHYSEEKGSELKKRVKALLTDIEDECPDVDALVFSGDLAYSGKKKQFNDADALLFEACKSRLHIPRKRIFIVPGNHDVDREKIDELREAGLASKISDNVAAEGYIEREFKEDARLSAYYDYLRHTFNTKGDYFYTAKETIKGLKIGIAGLNSSWRSFTSKELGRLYITAKQVNAAADELEKCDLKIAIMHHPEQWLHPSEYQITMEDLKRQFHIVLTGHLHENVSVSDHTPAHRGLRFTSPAIYNEEDASREGYNIYEINYEEKKVHCKFRKFVRTRTEFDKNVEHAKNGEFSADLPISSVPQTALLVQRLGGASEQSFASIKSHLKLFQNSEQPILVTPKINSLTWQKGRRSSINLKYTYDSITNQSAFVFGSRESGKSVFVESIVAHLNQKSADVAELKKAAFLLNCSKLEPVSSPDGWFQKLEAWYSENCSGLAGVRVVVCVDDHRDAAEYIEQTVKFFDSQGAVFMLTVSNAFRLDTIAASEGASGYQFLEIAEWGPSRIREFTKKFFAETEVDVDAAYLFVRSSLENTDLPANPVIVSLYLSVFPSIGNSLSSITFLTLLEKLENIRLDIFDKSSTYSFYNKKEILMRFAVECYKRGDLSIPRADVEKIISDFFKRKLLEVNVSRFLGILEGAKLIFVTTDSVQFSYYVFYDFYLAKAFAKNIVPIEEAIGSLKDCIVNADALSFLAGLAREDASTLKRVVDHVAGLFPEIADFSLKELDAYVNDFCDADDLEDTAEVAATKHLNGGKDLEEEDPHFERSKKNYGKLRKALRNIKKTDDEVGNLRLEMSALRTFYNIFRNLENIDGEQKVQFLETILNYHIQCNLDLIKFMVKLFNDAKFNAISAYVITASGQSFLTSNVGNQSLKGAIEECGKRTTNDFKKLLLILLYSDLGLPNHVKMLEGFLDETKSSAALELIYSKARSLLILHDGNRIPTALISLFKKSFERRQSYYSGIKSKGEYAQEYQNIMKARKELHWEVDASFE
jgi:predicted MPP superfamily phosphohydrolase